ncbi:enoyl-CoA hydratase/carnithine racemase [Achromobacter deleyi]|uniref:enoyl-CoA hydratase/isomerase family protein n=1 Tax=Achromobacter TaxID=222 RepID=UPI000CFC47C2|nr:MULTISPECIES: enoyl-CoA hydratase/isomerase family protein [Achromobacter]MDR6601738.1 enoyl-CoA hydratase/carnithine racemase [Achromobacter deleyi]PQZ70370.1 enoyl-CoA hydratase [Achromobacter sp. MYb9]
MEHAGLEHEGRLLTRICRVHAGIAWITLDRPEKANAVSSELLSDVIAALDAAEAESDVRAVIFSGAGRNFCAGADLVELLEGGKTAVRRLLDNFREVCRRFESSALPIVGMAHGAVRAGGLELLLCCDAIIAADDATIGDAHTLRELLPGGGSSVRLPRVIGHQRAKWMILSGSAISATQAMDWGIVHAVAPMEALRQCAIRLAGEMSLADRQTIQRAKSLFVAAHALPIAEALENEITTLEAHSDTRVMQDGLARFVGSR